MVFFFKYHCHQYQYREIGKNKSGLTSIYFLAPLIRSAELIKGVAMSVVVVVVCVGGVNIYGKSISGRSLGSIPLKFRGMA